MSPSTSIVVPTATFRLLYVFVVLLQHRRKVVHFTFASIIATATLVGSSGTDKLRGLRGKATATGAATGPTTLAGSYVGQVRFKATDNDD